MAIEQSSTYMNQIISADQDVELLADGFGADGSALGVSWWPAEGPVWWKEGGFLLFSDIGQSKRMKYSPKEGVSVFLEPTNEANGMTRDIEGRLVVCEHATRRVTRFEHNGNITVIADQYQGKRLNRPNDVVVKSDGSIYFTDPALPSYPDLQLDYKGVYRVSPDLKEISLLAKDWNIPNGLCFSPGESVLYVNDSRERHIRAFDVLDDGLVSSSRIFCVLKGDRFGGPDGMKCDLDGNVYCTGPGGIWVIEPSGKHIGTILVPEGMRAINMAWGDDDWKTLYFTGLRELFRVRCKIPGVPVPRIL